MTTEFEPDVDLWPARLAEYITRIPAQLKPGQIVNGTELVSSFWVEAGFPADVGPIVNLPFPAPLQAAEIEYLVVVALAELVRRGVLEADYSTGGWGPNLQSHLFRALGWDASGFGALYRYRLSVWAIAGEMVPWSSGQQRWPNVEELIQQARAAHRASLDVAAAVTARVAVEEAIRLALDDLGVPGKWDEKSAAVREEAMFRELTTRLGGGTKRAFDPMDSSSTRAALSAVRDRGNDAAHSGRVDHGLLHESLMVLLPQALASLAAAVTAAL